MFGFGKAFERGFGGVAGGRVMDVVGIGGGFGGWLGFGNRHRCCFVPMVSPLFLKSRAKHARFSGGQRSVVAGGRSGGNDGALPSSGTLFGTGFAGLGNAS